MARRVLSFREALTKRRAVAPGEPIAMSAGPIKASESFAINIWPAWLPGLPGGARLPWHPATVQRARLAG